MRKSKNDDAWKKIFEEHQILNKLENSDYIKISSSQIKNITGREARVMTKFDHKSQLPKLFASNNLSILPISRGEYIIGRFETFHTFNEDNSKIKKIGFPSFLESLTIEDITSEATAINCAFISGIISDFAKESSLHQTVNGRMSSSEFTFNINSSNSLCEISVKNSQIEIDGGYEGDNSLIIIEAKNYISDNFLIRQLFYPYRLWTGKINKKVRPVFLTYTNGVFHLREYIFENDEHYNSIKLVRQKKYTFQDAVINIETIKQILNSIEIVSEPEIPFPQADSFERIISLCELLKQKDILTTEEIFQNHDVGRRDINYYCRAGEYLKLLERRRVDGSTFWILTRSSKRILTLSIIERQIEFAKLILSHAVFNDVLKVYLKNGLAPTKKEIISIMCSHNLWNISAETTYQRRSSTIISWIDWIVSLVEE
jgi:hypothetical protein